MNNQIALQLALDYSVGKLLPVFTSSSTSLNLKYTYLSASVNSVTDVKAA